MSYLQFQEPPVLEGKRIKLVPMEQFKTDERSTRSQKAIERLGATKEGIMRNERILSNGYIRNAVLYSITNDEWRSVKQGFIDRESYYLSKQN